MMDHSDTDTLLMQSTGTLKPKLIPRPDHELFYPEGSDEATYKILKRIGRGTFSTVFLVECLADGQLYAMKAHFEAPSIEVHKRAVILNDAATIGKVQGHPNIIKMKEVYSRGKIVAVSDGQVQVKEVFAIMVLETIRGGELYYQIRKCTGFSLGVSNLFFQQLSGAL